MLDLETYLTGYWTIERRINDLQTGVTQRFSGIAEWSRANTAEPKLAVLEYREKGSLTTADQTIDSCRSLRYSFHSPSSVTVTQPDSNEWSYRWDITKGTSHVEFECGSDTYDGTLDLTASDSMQQTWKVVGPTKRYESVTHLVNSEAL